MAVRGRLVGTVTDTEVGKTWVGCRLAEALRDRVAAVAVLGGVTPSVGPDATCSGAIALARRFAPLMSVMRRPFATAKRVP